MAVWMTGRQWREWAVTMLVSLAGAMLLWVPLVVVFGWPLWAWLLTYLVVYLGGDHLYYRWRRRRRRAGAQ